MKPNIYIYISEINAHTVDKYFLLADSLFAHQEKEEVCCGV